MFLAAPVRLACDWIRKADQKFAHIFGDIKMFHIFSAVNARNIGGRWMKYDCESNQTPPRSRSLPEKLKVPQIVRKFPAFNGTRKFITAIIKGPLPVSNLS
jgi:hypothetical protein